MRCCTSSVLDADGQQAHLVQHVSICDQIDGKSDFNSKVESTGNKVHANLWTNRPWTCDASMVYRRSTAAYAYGPSLHRLISELEVHGGLVASLDLWVSYFGPRPVPPTRSPSYQWSPLRSTASEFILPIIRYEKCLGYCALLTSYGAQIWWFNMSKYYYKSQEPSTSISQVISASVPIIMETTGNLWRLLSPSPL